MLAHAPRGLTEQFLLARGFSVETLSSLVLATLAIVVTISQYSRQVLLDFAAAAGGRYLALTSSGSGGGEPAADGRSKICLPGGICLCAVSGDQPLEAGY